MVGVVERHWECAGGECLCAVVLDCAAQVASGKSETSLWKESFGGQWKRVSG